MSIQRGTHEAQKDEGCHARTKDTGVLESV
jgi:hypothetical protein